MAKNKKDTFSIFDVVAENLGKTSIGKKMIETKERINDKIFRMNYDMMKDEVQTYLKMLIRQSEDENEFLENVIKYIKKLHKEKDLEKISYLEFHLGIHDKNQTQAKKEIKGYYLYKKYPERFEDDGNGEIPIRKKEETRENESILALKKIGEDLKKEFNLTNKDFEKLVKDMWGICNEKK